MYKFPKLLPEKDCGSIPSPGDIGINLLIEEISKCIPCSVTENKHISSERIRDTIEKIVLSFENDIETVKEKQMVLGYCLENSDFIKVIDSVEVHPTQKPGRDDEFSKYAIMTQRFDTFAYNVSSIKEALEGKSIPKTLNDFLFHLERVEEKIKEARAHLNPKFELRIECQGTYKRSGVLVDMLPELSNDKRRYISNWHFMYVLLNKNDRSIKRGDHKFSFIEYKYSDYDDFFIRNLPDIIKPVLRNSLGKKPFFTQDYAVTGLMMYNERMEKIDGEFCFENTRKKRKTPENGDFSVSYYPHGYDNSHKSIIEFTRFMFNYQIMSPFEKIIQNFEDTIVELKAVSAVTKFLKNLENKGFPLKFPKIVNDDSNGDIYIKEMHHPLLAYLSENKKIIPNDVETIPANNVRLITGANNNGKTCYMDAIGLNQVMYQAGMPVVAKDAKMRVKDKILTHYVRPGDIKASQSRFAYERIRVLELTKNVSSDSLILCDELFTGTAPQDGEAVSTMVLDSLIRTGATMFFTTHYRSLGDEFRDAPFVTQLCCKLNSSTSPHHIPIR